MDEFKVLDLELVSERKIGGEYPCQDGSDFENA
jgi:hypothetical protein